MVTTAEESADESSQSPPSSAQGDGSGGFGAELPRYEGSRAEIAHWSGVLLDARAVGEVAREREACVKLAHFYTQRGTNLDTAVTLVRRALAIKDDGPLRAELAGWLAGLGDSAGAALELRGTLSLQGGEKNRGRTLVQAGVLMARAKRADAAALVFDEAAETEPTDPIPHELSGTIAAWAPDVIAPDQGALSYVAAAERRAAHGDNEGAFEDLLRGFELCPSSREAAFAVAHALDSQGRSTAADETLRDHANAQLERGKPELAMAVHAERLHAADDVNLGLAAALDLVMIVGGAALQPPTGLETRVDEIFTQAGLPDLVLARLERRAVERIGSARAAAFDALARLVAGPEEGDARAAEAWLEAAVAAPAQPGAFDALRDLAERSGDPSALVEAMIRIVSKERGKQQAPRPVLGRLAVELATLAENPPIDDPRLADWAMERARIFDDAHADSAAHAAARLETALAEREAEISQAERVVEGPTSREGRVEGLRTLARLLGKSPASEERVFATLAALCRAEPKDEIAARQLRRLFGRSPELVTRSELYASVLRNRLDAGLSRREQVRVRVELAGLGTYSASGETPSVRTSRLGELRPLLDLPDVDSYTASHVLLAASAASSPPDQAAALVALARSAERHTAALLLGAAAEAFHRANAILDARSTAEKSLDLDPACSRGASALARAAMAVGGRDAAVAIERALGLIVPRAWLCDALAKSLDEIEEHDLALAWTHRWLALTPGNRRAIGELLRRCQLGTDARRISEALSWVLAQPDPPDERVGAILDALTLLFSLDRAKGGQVSRRMLDVMGPSPIVRHRLGQLADEHDDAGLAIALVERAVASDFASLIDLRSKDASKALLLELAERRLAVGDFDGAALELLRAVDAGASAELLQDSVEELEHVASEAAAPDEHKKDKDREASVARGLGPDGIIALAEVKARLPGVVKDVRASVAERWRKLGAMRWDLAHDPRGSELALFAAAEAVGDQAAFDLYAHDLSELAGPEKAVAALFERLASLETAPPAERVAIAMAAGHLAAEHGLAQHALDAALAALNVEPCHADAISLAESQAAHVEGGELAIDHIYEALAEGALGMFGRRAAHYRAARQLERLGAREPALKHALAAFEAVPTEGTSWAMLTRLIDPVRGSEDAVALFQRLASRAKGDDKAVWYRRAIELAGNDARGIQRRFEVTLQALEVVTDASIVTALGEVVAKLEGSGARSTFDPAQRQRIADVTLRLLPRLEGPDGARAAAQLSRVLVQSAARQSPRPASSSTVVDAAFRALEKAVEIDGEVEVFDRIAPAAPAFAAFDDRASAFAEQVRERVKTKHALVGPPLLRFTSMITDSLGHEDASDELRAESVRRDAPEDGTGAIHGALNGEGVPNPRELFEDDPFADPSLLDSSPPPSAHRAEIAKRTSTGPPRRLELEPPDSEPSPLEHAVITTVVPTSAPALSVREVPDDIDVFFDDLRSDFDAPASPSPPRAIPAPKRSSSGTMGAVRPMQTSELAPVRDGFDVLFESDNDLLPPSERAALRASFLPPDDPDPEQDEEEDETEEEARPSIEDLEAQEAEARERGDHELVSELLSQRIAVAPSVDQVRVLKLRRAAVLEQRLSRVEDARRELLDVIEQDPNDRSALAFLADLFERHDAQLEAAPHHERLSRLDNVSEEDRKSYALRAARAFAGAGDTMRAIGVLDGLDPDIIDGLILRERVTILRNAGDLFSLVLALDQVVAAGNLSDEEVSALLLEGARAAGAAGDAQGALIRARRAARLAPTMAAAVIECTALEYRSRGTGTPREAQASVEALQSVATPIAADLVELHTFLLAEMLDVLHGGGSGLRELSHRHAEVGPMPLIAVGMAERLARSRSFEASIPLFIHALAGDLRGLRNKARVALAAADAALAANQLPEARGFLVEAEVAPELRAQIERRRREILAFDDDPMVARPILEELLKESTGLSKARVLQRLAKMTVETDFERAVELYEQALLLARRDRATADRIRTEILEILEARGLGKMAPAPLSDPPASIPTPGPDSTRPEVVPAEPIAPVEPVPEPVVEPVAAAVPIPAPEPEEQRTSQPDSGPEVVYDAEPEWLEEVPSGGGTRASTPTPVEPVAPIAAEPPAEPEAPDLGERVQPLGPQAPSVRPLFLNSQEESLFDQLVDGYIDAGDAMIERYTPTLSARARDVLIVRRHQVALKPGVRRTMTALREAALSERDDVYARALEHVLAVEAGSNLRPPPLFAQPREPELLSALLFRDVSSRETEVLSLIWESGMFRRELATYNVSSADRVPLTAASVLGEAYSEIAAALGPPRPFFHHRGDAAGNTLRAALLAQPAIVATGDYRQKSPNLVYQLASIHASCAPDLVLAAHLDLPSLENLFEAVLTAFGPVKPPDESSLLSPGAGTPTSMRGTLARLASELWQRINPRAERRLRDLCALGPLDPAIARATAHTAMRRAGLFACGDLGLALRILANEEDHRDLAPTTPGNLELACEVSPEVADLVRLATRAEYAEVRWQLPSPASIRRG